MNIAQRLKKLELLRATNEEYEVNVCLVDEINRESEKRGVKYIYIDVEEGYEC